MNPDTVFRFVRARVLPTALAALAALTSSSWAADTTIQRCEGADGKVTYSNTPCPSNTRQQRTIDYAPALEIIHPKAPGDEAGDADKSEKQPAKPEPKGTEAKPLGTIERSKPKTAAARPATPAPRDAAKKSDAPKAAPKPPVAAAGGTAPTSSEADLPVVRKSPETVIPSPGAAEAAASEAAKRQQQVGACDDLVRQIEYAQHEFDSASEGERASAELTLRRLQADHTSKCEPPGKSDAAKKS